MAPLVAQASAPFSSISLDRLEKHGLSNDTRKVALAYALLWTFATRTELYSLLGMMVLKNAGGQKIAQEEVKAAAHELKADGLQDVLIVSYNLVLLAQERFAGRTWHTLVADEAQAIKNAAGFVVITDPWWNPAAEDPAMGHARRIGQLRPVTVCRLVNKGTEERIVDLHHDKRGSGG